MRIMLNVIKPKEKVMAPKTKPKKKSSTKKKEIFPSPDVVRTQFYNEGNPSYHGKTMTKRQLSALINRAQKAGKETLSDIYRSIKEEE